MNFSLVTSSFLWFCCLSDHASSSMTAWTSKPRYSRQAWTPAKPELHVGIFQGPRCPWSSSYSWPPHPSPEAGPTEIYAPLSSTHVCLGSDKVKRQFPDGFLIHISKQNTGQTDIFLKMRASGVWVDYFNILLKKGKSEENRYDIGFMWQEENSMVAGH